MFWTFKSFILYSYSYFYTFHSKRGVTFLKKQNAFQYFQIPWRQTFSPCTPISALDWPESGARSWQHWPRICCWNVSRLCFFSPLKSFFSTSLSCVLLYSTNKFSVQNIFSYTVYSTTISCLTRSYEIYFTFKNFESFIFFSTPFFPQYGQDISLFVNAIQYLNLYKYELWEFICNCWILKNFPLSTLLPQKGQSWKRMKCKDFHWDYSSQREKCWRVDLICQKFSSYSGCRNFAYLNFLLINFKSY